MNINKLIFWISILAVFAMAAQVSIDSDTWWHLRAGQWIVQHKAVPRTDPFSYTRVGEPWEYPGWLVEVPMYWIFTSFGPGGLNIWTAAMIALTFYFVWMTLPGGVFLRAFVTIFAAVTSSIFWAARPHLVTMVLVSIYVCILEDYRCGRSNRLWMLPFLMILWANSHGGFVVGLILVGIYIIGSLDRLSKINLQHSNLKPVILYLKPLLLTILFLVLAVSINPYGLAMMMYPFKTVGIEALQEYIQEWQSPDFHQLNFQPFAWLLLLTLGIAGFSPRRLNFTEFLLAAVFAYMGLTAARNIALFAIVAPTLFSRYAVSLIEDLSEKSIFTNSGQDSHGSSKPILNLLILMIIIVAVGAKVWSIYPPEVNQERFIEVFPVQAVEFIKQNQISGRFFNSYNWGGYLLWSLPDYPVFVDGRTDLYSGEVLDQWVQVIQIQNG
jgi:hypothetical protein